MKGDSFIRTADVCIHRQRRPYGLSKFPHSFAVVILSMHLLLFTAQAVGAEDGMGSNLDTHQRQRNRESGGSGVNDGTRFETAGGLRYFDAEKPVRPYLNYLATKFYGNSINQVTSDSAKDEPSSSSALRNRPSLLKMERTKKGFNAIKSLMGLQSRSMSRSISMARSLSAEDYNEPAIQTRRTLMRQFRPRLRWG